jgi:NodT family efflux transporter outer membrane factor (OMF) lipoprotein
MNISRGLSAGGALGAMLLVVACASTQGLKPQASVADADRLAVSQSLVGAGIEAGAWPAQNWWTRFGDSQLDQLMAEGLAGSPNLRVALARARQASALAAAAASARSPRVDSSLSATRERFPANALIPPPVGGTWGTFDQLQASLSWDVDLWGKNRAAYEAAVGQARATAVDAQAARLALSVDMAHAYVQLQRAYLQRDVAQATVAQREQIYALTVDRNAAGIDSRLEVKQAESALPAAREQIVQLDETIALTRNQLAALLGQGPDRGLAIARPAATVNADLSLPASVPSQLLGRRPDIVAQRWRVEASRHGIEAARAQFYPNLNLAAVVGFQSLGTSGFLALGNRQIAVEPALSLPLFDAGQRRANLAAADAQYDLAVEQYNQSLSDALREVVDQLSSFRSVAQQRVEQKQALTASRDAYDLAVLRYREGVGNYLQVLTTETQLLAQQSLEVDLRARTLDVSINLVRALGGGFEDSTPPLAALTP